MPRIFNADWRTSDDHMRLAIQTRPDYLWNDVLWMVMQWIPENARSFTIYDLRMTDYHGHDVDSITGYANFRAIFYTRSDEGKIKRSDLEGIEPAYKRLHKGLPSPQVLDAYGIPAIPIHYFKDNHYTVRYDASQRCAVRASLIMQGRLDDSLDVALNSMILFAIGADKYLNGES